MNKVNCLKKLIGTLASMEPEEIPGETVCDMIDILTELAEAGAIGGGGRSYSLWAGEVMNPITADAGLSSLSSKLSVDSNNVPVGIELSVTTAEASGGELLTVGYLDDEFVGAAVVFGAIATIHEDGDAYTGIISIEISNDGLVTLVLPNSAPAGAIMDIKAGITESTTSGGK